MLCNNGFIGACLVLSLLVAGCAGTVNQTASTPGTQVNAPLKGQAAMANDRAYAGLSDRVKQDFAMATGALKNAKYTVAERMLKPITEKHEDFAAAWANLGIVYYYTDRISDAQQAFETALRKNSRNPVVHNYLGLINRQAGDFKKAQEHYAQAILIDPAYSNAYRNLGILYDLYLGELRKALESYEQYQKLVDGQSKDQEVAKWIVDLKRRL